MAKSYLKTPEEVVQALKEGKTVQMNGMEYGIINNIIVGFDKIIKEIFINPTIRLSEKPYVDGPEPLKLEVGKFYKTRRGDKVVCLCQQKEYYIHKLDTYVVGYWVDNTGRMLFNGKPEKTETDSDVVALWEDNNASKN